MTRSEQREQKRIEVVKAIVSRGEEVATVVRIFDVPRRTVFEWLARYRRGGWHALKEGRRTGRPRKVTGEIMAWIYEKITLGDPRQLQLPFCLWTLDIVRKVLKEHWGIQLSKSSVSRLLGHMGLSAQRPVYRSYKRDTKAIERYLGEVWPKVKGRVRRRKMKVFFVDEAAVRSDSHRGTTWAPVGRTPVAEDSGDRFTLKMISAVEPRGNLRFSFIEGQMNSSEFIAFLGKLRKDAGCPIVVVVDNASYHKSKQVREWERKHDVEMVTLPPYCPELNPDEQVWNHAKRRLGKLFVKTRDEMKKALMGIMRSIQRRKALVKSFFQLEDTKYASLC